MSFEVRPRSGKPPRPAGPSRRSENHGVPDAPPAPFRVCGAILDKYLQTGGPNGFDQRRDRFVGRDRLPRIGQGTGAHSRPAVSALGVDRFEIDWRTQHDPARDAEDGYHFAQVRVEVAWTPAYFCTDVEAAGLTSTYSGGRGEQQEQTAEEAEAVAQAERAERRRVIECNALARAATTRRREWVREKLGGRKRWTGGAVPAARVMCADAEITSGHSARAGRRSARTQHDQRRRRAARRRRGGGTRRSGVRGVDRTPSVRSRPGCSAGTCSSGGRGSLRRAVGQLDVSRQGVRVS